MLGGVEWGGVGWGGVGWGGRGGVGWGGVVWGCFSLGALSGRCLGFVITHWCVVCCVTNDLLLSHLRSAMSFESSRV